VIEIEGLRKHYRRRRGTTTAVDGLDLEVPSGGVYGFLGPNGCGKTTTIRCLLGLVRPSAGRIGLLGRGVPDGLTESIRRTGSIVETPAMFPTMTARTNLLQLALIDGIGPPRVDGVLATVGLAERADDLVKNFSLGMKQRLGLAAALLKDPELLILDEPANGLDPAGMREVRDVLRSLAHEGRTVFVSSHILSEIEQTCDRVAIVSKGRCIASGTVDEIISSAGHGAAVLVRMTDLDAGHDVLCRADLNVQRGDDQLRVGIDPDDAGEVTRLLADAGVWVTDLRPDRYSLEDVFLELTAESEVDPPSHWPHTSEQLQEVVS
jgi:ABC-2 type transport system ATP-binding protein